MEKLKNIHPGEVLNEEFLGPMKITAYRLSIEIAIPQTRIWKIITAIEKFSKGNSSKKDLLNP